MSASKYSDYPWYRGIYGHDQNEHLLVWVECPSCGLGIARRSTVVKKNKPCAHCRGSGGPNSGRGRLSLEDQHKHFCNKYSNYRALVKALPNRSWLAWFECAGCGHGKLTTVSKIANDNGCLLCNSSRFNSSSAVAKDEFRDRLKAKYPKTFVRVGEKKKSLWSAWFKCTHCEVERELQVPPVLESTPCAECETSDRETDLLVGMPTFVRYTRIDNKTRGMIVECSCGCGATLEKNAAAAALGRRLQNCRERDSLYRGVIESNVKIEAKFAFYFGTGKGKTTQRGYKTAFDAAIAREQLLIDMGFAEHFFNFCKEDREQLVPTEKLYMRKIRDLPKCIYRRKGGFRFKMSYEGDPYIKDFETASEAKAYRDEFCRIIKEVT